MLSLAERDSGRTVDVRVGEKLQISLPENASTGYRWEIDQCDEEFIEPLGSEAHYSGPAVGSGGETVFSFQGKKAGTGGIALKNWRRWEGDSSVVARFVLTLRVQP